MTLIQKDRVDCYIRFSFMCGYLYFYHYTVYFFQMVVAGMAAHTDINRAHEVANEVRRIHKQLKEAQVMAQTYNNRERLFGMPITDVRTHITCITCITSIVSYCYYMFCCLWYVIEQRRRQRGCDNHRSLMIIIDNVYKLGYWSLVRY